MVRSWCQQWAVGAIGLTSLFLPVFCRADVVWLKNGERREGLVVSQSKETIELADQVELAGRHIEVIPLTEVLIYLQTIDLRRLEELDPRFPYGYLDLADELARFPEDKLARELMRRLYLTCLTLDDAQTRHSSRLALVNLLAEDELHFLDLQGAGVLAETSPSPPRTRFVATRHDLDGLQDLLVHMRRESWEQAEELMREPRIRATQQQWGSVVTWGEIMESIGQRELSEKRLLQILRLEVALREVVAPLEVKGQAENWQASGWLPLPLDTGGAPFERRFGFEPRENVFRDGRWQNPTTIANQ
jgi:hypothetical protein